MPRDSGGNVITGPSDEELIPQVSDEIPLPQASFLALGPTWNSIGNPTAPKRDGNRLDGPDPEIVKTSDATESELGDNAFTMRHTIGLPDAEMVAMVTPEQLHRAG